MLILDDLWNGAVDLMGQRHLPKEEYTNVIRRIERHEEAIKLALSETGLAALEAFKQAELDYACLCEHNGFIGGFQLGVKLILDALVEPSKITP